MSEKSQNFLQRFMQKNTPFRSFADAALLGATDFDKKGRNKDQTSGFSAAFRRGVAGTADAFTGNMFDFDKQGSNEAINKKKIEREQKKKLEEAAFEKKLADIRGGDLTLNPDGTVSTVEKYGPKKRAGDLLERFATNRIDQGQLLGYNQALMNQEVSALSEANRQRLETNLAFDRDSPTRMQERQLKAKTGEALLAEAVAKQATSAAQIGGLGTARTFGRGSTSIT